MDMNIVKQEVIAKCWPSEKNKVGDEYRSLSKQIGRIIHCLSNPQTDAAWLPLDWMGQDKVVELVLFIYERSSDRMLLDRLSRKRKIPDYSRFRMMEKEEHARQMTESICEVDRNVGKESAAKLQDIERVNVLDSIAEVNNIIDTLYKKREYSNMLIKIESVNRKIYRDLIDEYQGYMMMGFRICYPGYIAQYLDVVHWTIYRLIIEAIMTNPREGKIEERLEGYTEKIVQIINETQEKIDSFRHDHMWDAVAEEIMIRFTEYLYRTDYYKQLKEIMLQLKETPTYIRDQKNIETKRTHCKNQEEMNILIDAASNTAESIFSYVIIDESILYSEIFLEKSVYERRTARTVVRHILAGDEIDLLSLRFLELKYLRGYIYSVYDNNTYKVFCDLCEKIREVVLLPFSVFDDRDLYKIIFELFSDLLYGYITCLCAND